MQDSEHPVSRARDTWTSPSSWGVFASTPAWGLLSAACRVLTAQRLGVWSQVDAGEVHQE